MEREAMLGFYSTNQVFENFILIVRLFCQRVLCARADKSIFCAEYSIEFRLFENIIAEPNWFKDWNYNCLGVRNSITLKYVKKS